MMQIYVFAVSQANFFTLLWVMLCNFFCTQGKLEKMVVEILVFFIACAICHQMGRVFLQFSCMNFGVYLQRETVK